MTEAQCGARRADRDLVADRVRGPVRRRRRGRRVDGSPRTAPSASPRARGAARAGRADSGEGELTQLEASTGRRERLRRPRRRTLIAAVDRRRADGRARLLRPEELSAGRRRAAGEAGRKPKPKPQAEAAHDTAQEQWRRRRLIALGRGRVAARHRALARRGREGRERVDLYFDGRLDASRSHGDSPEAAALLVARARRAFGPPRREARRARRRDPRARLPRGRLRPALGAPLELLPRQVPLRDAARPARRRSASGSRPPSPSTSRTPCGSPAPSSVPSRSRRPRRSPPGLPFLIVRKEAKEYGTANRLEGVFEPGERVCLVEDVVTSGGAAVEAVDALREAGLECRIAVCVVDREEGGADALARRGVRLVPLFRAGELLSAQKTAAKPHG